MREGTGTERENNLRLNPIMWIYKCITQKIRMGYRIHKQQIGLQISQQKTAIAIPWNLKVTVGVNPIQLNFKASFLFFS